MARHDVFNPEYEAELRKGYAGPHGMSALIGGVREALKPEVWNGVERARAMIAIWDEMQGKSE